MSETKPRPVPKPNVYVDTQPFWDAAKAGRLVLQYCTETGKFQHYPRPVSIYTGKRKLEWREVSGKGKVYAHTISRIPTAGFDGPIPVVTVELDEGVRILGNMRNCAPEEVKIGMRVKVCWEPMSDSIQYPAFEPDRA